MKYQSPEDITVAFFSYSLSQVHLFHLSGGEGEVRERVSAGAGVAGLPHAQVLQGAVHQGQLGGEVGGRCTNCSGDGGTCGDTWS